MQADGWNRIADCRNDDSLEPEAEEANARLISAAPDLLEACELVLQTTDPAVFDVVRAAVKKARGK